MENEIQSIPFTGTAYSLRSDSSGQNTDNNGYSRKSRLIDAQQHSENNIESLASDGLDVQRSPSLHARRIGLVNHVSTKSKENISASHSHVSTEEKARINLMDNKPGTSLPSDREESSTNSSGAKPKNQLRKFSLLQSDTHEVGKKIPARLHVSSTNKVHNIHGRDSSGDKRIDPSVNLKNTPRILANIPAYRNKSQPVSLQSCNKPLSEGDDVTSRKTSAMPRKREVKVSLPSKTIPEHRKSNRLNNALYSGVNNGNRIEQFDSSESSDILSALGIVKQSNGLYRFNDMELEREELIFVASSLYPGQNLELILDSNVQQGHITATNGNIHNEENSDHTSSLPNPVQWNSSVTNPHRQIKFRRQPITHPEKMLANFTQELLTSSVVAAHEDSECSVCLCSVEQESPALNDTGRARDLVGTVVLANCGHVFHCSCLLPLLNKSSFTCPMCKCEHGETSGTQPTGGSMVHKVIPTSVNGYPGVGTIVITYSIPEGVQGAEHPNPGAPYHVMGFPRKAYLPDNSQGREVLAMLKKAFSRRLIFTVGNSLSSDKPDCVIWANISHKTLIHKHQFGYPDPYYLDNVTLELAAMGINKGN